MIAVLLLLWELHKRYSIAEPYRRIDRYDLRTTTVDLIAKLIV
jgi:hypothetical protein